MIERGDMSRCLACRALLVFTSLVGCMLCSCATKQASKRYVIDTSRMTLPEIPSYKQARLHSEEGGCVFAVVPDPKNDFQRIMKEWRENSDLDVHDPDWEAKLKEKINVHLDKAKTVGLNKAVAKFIAIELAEAGIACLTNATPEEEIQIFFSSMSQTTYEALKKHNPRWSEVAYDRQQKGEVTLSDIMGAVPSIVNTRNPISSVTSFSHVQRMLPTRLFVVRYMGNREVGDATSVGRDVRLAIDVYEPRTCVMLGTCEVWGRSLVDKEKAYSYLDDYVRKYFDRQAIERQAQEIADNTPLFTLADVEMLVNPFSYIIPRCAKHLPFGRRTRIKNEHIRMMVKVKEENIPSHLGDYLNGMACQVAVSNLMCSDQFSEFVLSANTER